MNQPHIAEGDDWESTERLGRIIDALPFPVSFIDSEQNLLFCNSIFEDWFQTSLTDMEGRSLEEIISPPLFRSVEPDLQQVLAGTGLSSEATTAFPDGVTRRVRRTYVPCKSVDGSTAGCISLVQDVTKTIDNRAESGRERDLFEGIFRTMPDAIALLSGKRDIAVNPPVMSGPIVYRRGDMLGADPSFPCQGHSEYERRTLIGSKASAGENAQPQSVRYR